MANHPVHHLLELYYDETHRAHVQVDEGRALKPLRLRTHAAGPEWDDRYATYMERAGFLELVRTVNQGLPNCDPALLSAAVDR